MANGGLKFGKIEANASYREQKVRHSGWMIRQREWRREEAHLEKEEASFLYLFVRMRWEIGVSPKLQNGERECDILDGDFVIYSYFLLIREWIQRIF